MQLAAMIVVSGLIAGAAAASDDYVFVDSFESGDCTLPLACPAPASGKACIAGQLADVATTQPLRARFNVGLACGQGAVGGPCDLAVAAFDALEFEADPASAAPLGSAGTVVDGCGRFRVSDLNVPATGYVAVAAQSAPGGDVYTTSATVLALAPNQQVSGLEEPVARTVTVTQWSALGGVDFASNGAVLACYSTGGVPTAGVTASRDGGAIGTVRYFSDADAQRQFVSSSATTTGANGSALIANATLATYSGTGAETSGCQWSHVTSGAPPGVLVFARIDCN